MSSLLLLCLAAGALVLVFVRLRVVHARVARALQEAIDLADAAPDGILVVARDGTVVLANARITPLLGHAPAELIGCSVERLVPEVARARHRERRQRFLHSPSSRPMGQGAPLQAVRKDGTLLPVSISLSSASYGGRPVTICFIRDVAEAQRTRTALTEANAELTRRMNALEAQSRSLRQLERVSELLQCCATEPEVLSLLEHWVPRFAGGAEGAIYLHAASREQVERVRAWGEDALLSTGFESQECWALRRGRPHRSHTRQGPARCGHAHGLGGPALCIPLAAQGEAIGLLTVGRAEGSFTEYLLVSLADRAAIAVANLRLRDVLRAQTILDPLTGLSNRRHFEDLLERETARARAGGGTVALLLIDLDHFKRMNDAWGHAAGDAALRALAERLKRIAGAGDCAARLGGDEFALLLRDGDAARGHAAGERLSAELRTLRVGHREVSLPALSVSIGVAVAPADAAQSEELLRAADERLYAAKRGGRGRTVTRVTEITPEVKHVGT